MSKRKAPADAPGSTFVDPEHRRRRRAELKAEDERCRALAGPLEIRRVEKP